jgi:hypothetical protein
MEDSRSIIQKIFCKKCAINLFHRLKVGFFLTLYLDTRSVEFMAGVLAIYSGFYLWSHNIWFGWLFIIFGFLKFIFSIVGPYHIRKNLALIAIFSWIFLGYIVGTFHHEDSLSEAIFFSSPYIFFAMSSILTYFGMWRYIPKEYLNYADR